jgi:uncharacterized repeat protein (TIGR03803 family)
MRGKNIAVLCSVILAGCARAGNSTPLPLQAAALLSLQTDYHTLYSFKGHPSGATPTGLTAFQGALYGTAAEGGAHTFGSIFVRNSAGVRMLYSFKGGKDGAEPEGALVALDGNLYGTTGYGGARGDGTVFAISNAGVERVLYSFKGGTDGATPILGTLLVAGGTLYGTTSAGATRNATSKAASDAESCFRSRRPARKKFSIVLRGSLRREPRRIADRQQWCVLWHDRARRRRRKRQCL